ncbi:MAG TPA: M1 family metallopeptidase [Thermoanaerobaculia bacterium]|nr:M1 family metallopeptidase [Thermoanaerobaculia bacterium]
MHPARIFSALLILLALPASLASQPPTRPATFDVQSYSADIDIQPAEKTVSGEVTIALESRTERLSEVVLDAPGLTIASVREGDMSLAHRLEDGRLRITLDPPAYRGDVRTLRIRYSGKPEKGMRASADAVFTSFHTDRWMVVNSDPGDKATIELRLTLPEGLEVVASGRRVSRDVLPDGRVRHVWKEDRPVSPFLYGFAAARFRETTARESPVELRFLAPGFTPEELRTIFARTGQALRYFERRAGVPFPGAQYSQVLLPEAPAQEMNVLTLLGEDYGRSVLDDPREDYLVAHELAHQWWANLLTCESWSDFWLNEGVVTFMVAAYKEMAWGRDEYEREMLIARLRYARAVAEGARRPIATDAWTRAEDMSGPITYSKGALVLHLLRRQLGDEAFWEGFRLYTQAGAKSGLVSTRDLQRAMEQASGQPLAWFFDQWVYSIEPELIARHRVEPGAVVVDVEQRGDKPWRIGMQIAVETADQRVSRRVVLTRAQESFRIPITGEPLSVRIDEGGFLPRAVRHDRSWEMLAWQTIHEPDPAGRAGALMALADACGAEAGPSKPAGCAGLPNLLRQRADDDGARVVRQIAERTLEQLAPKPDAPDPPARSTRTAETEPGALAAGSVGNFCIDPFDGQVDLRREPFPDFRIIFVDNHRVLPPRPAQLQGVLLDEALEPRLELESDTGRSNLLIYLDEQDPLGSRIPGHSILEVTPVTGTVEVTEDLILYELNEGERPRAVVLQLRLDLRIVTEMLWIVETLEPPVPEKVVN